MRDVTTDEKALVCKLVATGHLSVPERSVLPGGKAKATLVFSVIEEAVRMRGWFPDGLRPENDFDGGLIERRGDGTCMIRWKGEMAYLHYALIDMQECRDVEEAAKAFAQRYFGSNIDGVPIDWNA